MENEYNNGDGVYSGQTYRYSGSESTSPVQENNLNNNVGMPTGGQAPKPPKKEKKKGGIFGKIILALVLGLVFGAAAGGGLFLVNYFTDYGDAGIVKDSKDYLPEERVAPPADRIKDEDATYIIPGEPEPEIKVMDATDVVKMVMPSVVSIEGKYTVTSQGFFGRYTQETTGSGSGIILAKNDTQLLIATNNHVVEDSKELHVQFIDGTSANANIKGRDADMDLAVITVNLSDIDSVTMDKIKVATLGNSDEIEVGQAAIAIGNALGYGQSVTAGVVSALDRSLTISETGQTIRGLVQTDAAINPGNSGGALVNMFGEVIGINSSKIGGAMADGVGFAIPISAASPILEDIVTSTERVRVSEATRGYLGINGVTVTSEASSMYGMPVGVQIRKIYATENSNMQPGDIIKRLGTKEVESMEALQEELSYHQSGEVIPLTVYRFVDGDYEEMTYDITLLSRDEVSR